MEYFKKIILAGCISLSIGCFSQFTIPVDSSGIWYTNKQDLNCLRCLMNEETRKEETLLCYEEVESCRNDYSVSVELNEQQRVENVGLREDNHKLKGQRNAFFGVSVGLVIVSIFLGIY